MESYNLYGLQVASTIGIDGLTKRRFRRYDAHIQTANDLQSEVCSDSQQVSLSWPQIGDFLIQDGSLITHVPADNTDEADLRNVLLGTCLATLCHQRGLLPIHGSVAEVNGQAIGFIGPKLAGKSTSVGALIERGHGFVADDILAVRFEEGQPVAIPGFPLSKLEPQWVSNSFPGGPAQNPETGRGKYYYDVSDAFEPDPIPLSTINLLEPITATSVETEPISGHEAAMTLVQHAWPTRLRASSTVTEWTGDDGPALDRYARLAEHCPVQRLSVDHSHGSLTELGQDLEAAL
ncbi:hypothetical protein [Halosimplex amylolyticum]|uniref:hypothetical protein n=1 Tax=Halosimplex amylolyticum TaxID=3396616 RepID=UPI003F545236